jgi:hypothetical protein
MMTIETAVFRFAGVMILLSLALTTWVHPNFIYFTAFIGLNLFQYSFSGFCPVAILFKKMGLKPACEG